MPREYLADIAVANRLFAARNAAGFRSGREAALKFGLSPSLLRAHETATRGIEDAALLKQYARSFGVGEAWLRTGQGDDGVRVDPKREDRLRRRNSGRNLATPEIPLPARRLRVARRLRGYRTLTDAAKQFKWNRTTASSHEAGQNAVSPEWARLYGAAYSVNPEWILHGTLPSGFPPEVEPHLEALGELHAEPESVAREHFPQMPPSSKPVPKLPKFKRISGKPLRLRPAEDVPEVTTADVVKGGSGERASQHRFSFPPRYLGDVLGCEPKTTIVIPSPNAFSDVAIGDRLIVDTSQTNAHLEGEYVAISPDGTLAVAGGPGREAGGTGRVIGRVVAKLKTV